jgi:hypothetical protein
LVDAVLAAVANGKPLEHVCRDNGITVQTWHNWRRADEALDIAHGRAREDGFDVIAANTRETARGFGDSTADVQRDKLIIDTDLKLLAKWDPRRYGDKQLVGSDPDNPLPSGVVVSFKG